MPAFTCVLCVPGTFPSRDAIEAILPDGFTLDLDEAPDPRMQKAFAASLSQLPMTAEELAVVGDHTHVAYVVHDTWTKADAAENAHTLLLIGHALLDLGGVGVKVENAGVAHAPDEWRRISEKATAAHEAIQTASEEDKLTLRYAFWRALHEAFVHRLIFSPAEYYTCGMHVLGERDILISRPLVQRIYGEAKANDRARWLMDDLATYVLAESEVAGGHTFSRAPRNPRFRIVLEPNKRHEPEDLYFNPHGYLRLTEVGGYA